MRKLLSRTSEILKISEFLSASLTAEWFVYRKKEIFAANTLNTMISSSLVNSSRNVQSIPAANQIKNLTENTPYIK